MVEFVKRTHRPMKSMLNKKNFQYEVYRPRTSSSFLCGEGPGPGEIQVWGLGRGGPPSWLVYEGDYLSPYPSESLDMDFSVTHMTGIMWERERIPNSLEEFYPVSFIQYVPDVVESTKVHGTPDENSNKSCKHHTDLEDIGP